MRVVGWLLNARVYMCVNFDLHINSKNYSDDNISPFYGVRGICDIIQKILSVHIRNRKCLSKTNLYGRFVMNFL